MHTGAVLRELQPKGSPGGIHWRRRASMGGPYMKQGQRDHGAETEHSGLTAAPFPIALHCLGVEEGGWAGRWF